MKHSYTLLHSSVCWYSNRPLWPSQPKGLFGAFLISSSVLFCCYSFLTSLFCFYLPSVSLLSFPPVCVFFFLLSFLFSHRFGLLLPLPVWQSVAWISITASNMLLDRLKWILTHTHTLHKQTQTDLLVEQDVRRGSNTSKALSRARLS